MKEFLRIDNNKIFIFINKEKEIIKYKKGNPTLLKRSEGNKLIKEITGHIQKVNVSNYKKIDEITNIISYIMKLRKLCLNIKGINYSTFISRKVKENAFSRFKDEIRYLVVDKLSTINQSSLTDKEKDILSKIVSDNKLYVSGIRTVIHFEYFFYEDLNVMDEKFEKIINEEVMVLKELSEKVNDNYKQLYLLARSQKEVLEEIKKKNGENLVNWSGNKITRELNKITNEINNGVDYNNYYIKCEIEKEIKILKERGTPLKRKTNNNINKLKTLEERLRYKENLSQEDYIYLFKNSKKDYNLEEIVSSLNAESAEKILFSKLKCIQVKLFDKNPCLIKELAVKINKNLENYERLIELYKEENISFSSIDINYFYEFLKYEDFLLVNKEKKSLFNNFERIINNLSLDARVFIYKIIKKKPFVSIFEEIYWEFNSYSENLEYLKKYSEETNCHFVTKKSSKELVSRIKTEDLDRIFKERNLKSHILLFNTSWIKETQNLNLKISLIKNDFVKIKDEKEIVDLIIEDICTLNKYKIEDFFEMTKISPEIFSSDEFIKLIAKKEYLEYFVLNYDEIKYSPLINKVFKELGEDRFIELMSYNKWKEISLSDLPPEFLKNKEVIKFCLNNLIVKDLKFNFSTYLNKSLYCFTREDLLALKWFKNTLSQDERPLSTFLEIINNAPHVINEEEWFEFLYFMISIKKEKLFMNETFRRIYKSIPESVFILFFSGKNDKQIKEICGDIMSYERRNMFNYIKDILERAEMTISKYYLINKNKELDYISFRSLYGRNQKGEGIYGGHSHRRFFLNTNYQKKIINNKEELKYELDYLKKLEESNINPFYYIKYNKIDIHDLNIMNFFNTNEVNELLLKKDNFVSAHYSDNLQNIKLERLTSLLVEEQGSSSFIASLMYGEDITALLKNIGFKGRNVIHKICKRVFQEKHYDGFAIVKATILLFLGYKEDQISIEISKEYNNIDDFFARLVLEIEKDVFDMDDFKKFFKNRISLGKNYNQLFKMLNIGNFYSHNEMSFIKSTYSDAIEMTKSLEVRTINFKEKRSISYFHDLMTSILLLKKNPNYKFNYKDIIKVSKLNKHDFEYKINIVRTNHELIFHSKELGHCVGTSNNYRNGILEKDMLIFGLCSDKKLLFTVAFSLSDKKIFQTEGKSRSSLNKEKIKQLEEIINSCLI